MRSSRSHPRPLPSSATQAVRPGARRAGQASSKPTGVRARPAAGKRGRARPQALAQATTARPPRRRVEAPASGQEPLAQIVELLRGQGPRLLRGAGALGAQAARVPAALARALAALEPLTELLSRAGPVEAAELGHAIDRIFVPLYDHPLTAQVTQLTRWLRRNGLLPNEDSTESLIRFIVEQAVARSPIPVPPAIVDEFWLYFDELMSSPELRGLGELGLDMIRLVLRTYEPLLAEVISELKAAALANQQRLDALLGRVRVVRGDLAIIRRQLKALRYIKPFLQTDARDFATQAQIVARMVREFGPFFIKMAQVAAASADFLPEEIARELAVFQEDVAPMSPDEARAAIEQSLGQPPERLYYGFDATRPLKSGSIGSVYLAKKPVVRDGVERLVPVIVKVGRHNLDREFLMGRTAIGLMLLSSHYWAPHSKLAPFLQAMAAQIEAFTEGFRGELEFEREAAIQARFAQRTRTSRIWHVPQVYASGPRVIEMEYVDGAVGIARAVSTFAPRAGRRYRRRLARALLHSVIVQAVVHREVHGDLHPGNVLVDARATLHLIDWGNTVVLDGLGGPVWRYARGVLSADAGLLADALIDLVTDRASALARRDEIRAALQRTLAKKGIAPLNAAFPLTLWREGSAGWLRRLNLLSHLMSNTQQLGLVVRGEYLHLSRSIAAIAGTLATLYQGVPGRSIALDLLRVWQTLPATLLHDWVRDIAGPAPVSKAGLEGARPAFSSGSPR